MTVQSFRGASDEATPVGPAARPVGVVAMGDFGDERCGVGSSVGAFAAQTGDVIVLDAAAPGFRAFVRAARAAARTGAPCVGEYPTRSTVYDTGLLPRLLALRIIFGRRRLRLHLHEYRRLRRKLKWPVKLAMLLPSRVVVSSASERTAVQGALRGIIGRRCEVVVAPPSNGTAPGAAAVAAALIGAPDRERTVGVFGMRREDKGVDWLLDVLERLDRRFDRLVLAGDGWQEQEWSAPIVDRYEVSVLGHVPEGDLPRLFGSWGLAIAPLWEPAHDGRMSLRTPLAYGVPTMTVGPPGADLTLAPGHLLVVPPADPSDVPTSADRRAGADEVAAFERHATAALTDALFGPPTVRRR